MAVIGELVVMVKGNAEPFARELAKATSVGRKFVGTMTKALAPLIGATGFGVAMAAQAEKTEVAFEVLLKSAEKARDTLEDLREFSKRNALNLSDVQQAGKSLLAAEIPAGRLTEKIGHLADISAISGIRLNELASIFGKMKSGGLIQGEELNQLADRGLPIFRELANVLDTTPDKIKKMGSEGQITFAHLEKAFANLTAQGGQFFGANAKLAETAAGKWQKLKNTFREGLQQIGKALLTGVDMNKFIGSLQSIASIFSEKVVPLIAQGIEKLAGVVDFVETITRDMSQVQIGGQRVAADDPLVQAEFRNREMMLQHGSDIGQEFGSMLGKQLLENMPQGVGGQTEELKRKQAQHENAKALGGSIGNALRGLDNAIGNAVKFGIEKIQQGSDLARKGAQGLDAMLRPVEKAVPMALNTAITSGSAAAMRLQAAAQQQHKQEQLQEDQVTWLERISNGISTLVGQNGSGPQDFETDTTGAA